MPTSWAETHVGRFIIKDRIVVFVLFLILGILSITGITATRQATKAAEKAAQAAASSLNLKDCITPGTTCYNLAQESAKASRAYQASLVQSVGICLIEVPANQYLPDKSKYEKAVSDCVMAHTIPNPASTTTTTATTTTTK